MISTPSVRVWGEIQIQNERLLDSCKNTQIDTSDVAVTNLPGTTRILEIRIPFEGNVSEPANKAL